MNTGARNSMRLRIPSVIYLLLAIAPVSIIASTLPFVAGAREHRCRAVWYIIASSTSFACSSPSAIRCSTSLQSLVPRWAVSPLCPLILRIISSQVYFPLKHIFTRATVGSAPALDGVKGPSPSRALLHSMALPL